MSASRDPRSLALIYAGGLLFGLGLASSGMARPEVVLSFLRLEDLGLLFVMGGAAVVTGVTFTLGIRYLDRAPLTARDFTRRRKDLDRNVVLGGGIFGVGWGLSGLCPGAAVASLGIGNYPAGLALAGMFLGAYTQGYIRSKTAREPESAGTSSLTSGD